MQSTAAHDIITRQTSRLNQPGWGHDKEQYGSNVYDLCVEAQWASQQPDGQQTIHKLVRDHSADPEKALAEVFCILCGNDTNKVARAAARIMHEWVPFQAEQLCEAQESEEA